MQRMIPVFVVCSFLMIGCGFSSTPENQGKSDKAASTDVVKQATVVACGAGSNPDCEGGYTGNPCSNGLGRTRYNGGCVLNPNGNGSCICSSDLPGGSGGGSGGGGSGGGGGVCPGCQLP